MITRREALLTMGAVAAGALVPHAVNAKGAVKMKVGLYSITYLGVWYRGDALSLEDLVKRAKEYGYDGVEIDGKRPHGNPLDMPTKRCNELRRFADDQGVEIYAVAANNDFSNPVPENRECQIVYMRDLIRMTADLGAKLLRVFLAWPGVTRHPQLGRYDIAKRIWQETHKDFPAEETWSWCRAALVESARIAGDHGVTLALQNHGPVIEDHPDILRMIREVASPHLKACLDAPLLKDKSDAATRQAALGVRSLQVLSHFGGEYERNANGRAFVHKGQQNMPAFIRAMREIGFNGYFGYELCHPLPVVEGQTVGRDFADKNARLACEYLKSVIAEATR
ncbi:MAG: sugar phosphate isomerase/epimerase [Verrucomicrobia bacterium]|nr:sugar phosphate isomerase/epimerase [Verrucomicrobiota bacterium]